MGVIAGEPAAVRRPEQIRPRADRQLAGAVIRHAGREVRALGRQGGPRAGDLETDRRRGGARRVDEVDREDEGGRRRPGPGRGRPGGDRDGSAGPRQHRADADPGSGHGENAGQGEHDREPRPSTGPVHDRPLGGQVGHGGRLGAGGRSVRGAIDGSGRYVRSVGGRLVASAQPTGTGLVSSSAIACAHASIWPQSR